MVRMGNNFPSGSEEKIYISDAFENNEYIVGSEYVERYNDSGSNLNLIPGEESNSNDSNASNKFFVFPMMYYNCEAGEYCTQNFGGISYSDENLLSSYNYYNFTNNGSWPIGHTEKIKINLPVSGGEFKEDVKGNLYYVRYYSGEKKYVIYKFTKIEEPPNLVASITTEYKFTKFIVNETSDGTITRIAGIRRDDKTSKGYYGYCNYNAKIETNTVNWISDPIKLFNEGTEITISETFYLIQNEQAVNTFYIIDENYKYGYYISFPNSEIKVTQILNDSSDDSSVNNLYKYHIQIDGNALYLYGIKKITEDKKSLYSLYLYRINNNKKWELYRTFVNNISYFIMKPLSFLNGKINYIGWVDNYDTNKGGSTIDISNNKPIDIKNFFSFDYISNYNLYSKRSYRTNIPNYRIPPIGANGLGYSGERGIIIHSFQQYGKKGQIFIYSPISYYSYWEGDEYGDTRYGATSSGDAYAVYCLPSNTSTMSDESTYINEERNFANLHRFI